mmetsp:Transcript_24936/g.64769  ORF Transcript_24936/g.64769 Transcript_24936/m.64769 type:complete len:267 (+) Transcript_24936:208-1008(+)
MASATSSCVRLNVTFRAAPPTVRFKSGASSSGSTFRGGAGLPNLRLLSDLLLLPSAGAVHVRAAASRHSSASARHHFPRACSKTCSTSFEAPDLSDQLCAVFPARALVSWNSTPTYARFDRWTTTSSGPPPGAGRPPGSISQGSVDFGGSVRFASVAFSSASAFFLSTLGPFSSFFFISRLCSAFFFRFKSSSASAGSSSSPITLNLSLRSLSFNGYRSGGSKARNVTFTSGLEFLPALSSFNLPPVMSTITPNLNQSSLGFPTGL